MLIPGLPDDLARECLGAITHGHHANLACVCRRWRRFFQGDEIVKAQRGRCGDWLLVLMEKSPQSDCWIAFDPNAGVWHPLPASPRPKAASRLVHRGFGCVSTCRKLFVIGGYYIAPEPAPYHKFFATTQVLEFDLCTQVWRRVANMQVARSNFACAAVGGKIYVAGGCSSSSRAPLSSAEAYDVASNSWSHIKPLPAARDACVGIVLEYSFYVLAGIAEGPDQRLVEVFSPATGTWRSVHDFWPFSTLPSPVAAMNGELYVFNDGRGDSIRVYNPKEHSWQVLGPPGLNELHGLDFGLCGLRNKLYLVGGKLIRWIPPDGGCWKPFESIKLNTVTICDVSVPDKSLVWTRAQDMPAGHCGQPVGAAAYEDS